jgi:ferredoxin-NADP reductase
VVESVPVADDVRRIVLQPERPSPSAPPGSHVDVRIHVDGRSDVRSYSVVGTGERGTELVLGVQLAAQSRGGSAYLHSLRPGAALQVTAPLQDFPLQYGRPEYVLLAGGIGVTALVAMAADLRRRGADYRVVHVARSRGRLAFADELQREHGDRLSVHLDDEHGRFDVQGLVDGLGPDAELYLCGPIPLLDAAKRAWAHAGRPRSRLRFESFGSSGSYAPEAFRVVVPRLGVEAVVPPDGTLLDALERCGAEVMYDCRRGECGLCTVQVLGLEGVLDHRDVFLSDEQHAEGGRMQACVSRAVSGRTAGTAPAHEGAVVTIDVP